MTWTMPAEFAPQERIWMAFPRVGNTLGDDAASADEARDTWAAVANAAAGFEPVTMVVDPSAVAEARKRLSGEIELVEAPLDDYWMRDIGPTFVLDDDGALGAVDWTFNGWGANAWATWERDDRIASTVAGLAGAVHLPSPLVNEGGGIHVDGEGTVLLTETVQLDPRRNPYTTKQRVEWELQRTIGATTFIWLPRGLTRDYESAGTRGHVDMVATFAAPGRVLLHWQDDPSHPDYAVVRQVRAVLEAGDGCRGPQPRDHRAPRARDAARRGRLRRLELRQPPRRERRRDRVRLRRAGCRRPRRRDPRRRLRPRGRHDRRAADPGSGAAASTASPSSSRTRSRDEHAAPGRARHRSPICGAALESGATTSVALVEAYLARIEAYDQNGIRLNALVEFNPDARAEAEAVRPPTARGRDARTARRHPVHREGQLHGARA